LVTNTTLGLALLNTDMLFCSSFVRKVDVAAVSAIVVGSSTLRVDANTPTATVIMTTTKVVLKVRIIIKSIYRVDEVLREIVSSLSRKRLSA
jgi:hypothetical protein